MSKKLLICLMAAAVLCVFTLGTAMAKEPADVLIIKVPEAAGPTNAKGKPWKKNTTFPHKLHVEKSGVECLACHHKAESVDAIKGCAVEGCHIDTNDKGKTGFKKAWHSKKMPGCDSCHKNKKKKELKLKCKQCHNA